MQKLGLVGGTGPESTVEYYQSIISEFQKKTGNEQDLPEFLVHSINMYRIFKLLESGDLAGLIDYLSNAVHILEKAGCDFAVIAANTPHIVFDEVQRKVNIPMISIIEETVSRAEELDFSKIGLLGTKFTMENEFFKEPFIAKNKEIIVPTEEEQQYIHEKIVDELEKGLVSADTKKEFLQIVGRMSNEAGIQAFILGCTELPMLIKPEDTTLPQLDTMKIHVEKIVDTMLKTTL